MLTKEIENIMISSKDQGWVLEPEAKKILDISGIEVPEFGMAADFKEAAGIARDIGYPIVAKIVSPAIIHKSDTGGVIAGIENESDLENACRAISEIEGFEGILIEEMLSGIELIVGAKIDFQFGPVILLGLGGTMAEIYKDTALRMAPLTPEDVESMVNGLKAGQLIHGYRGSEPVNMESLTKLIVSFSRLVMDLEDWVESIDLNPVMCTGSKCTAADARIMLA